MFVIKNTYKKTLFFLRFFFIKLNINYDEAFEFFIQSNNYY